jgi:acyl-CoA thioesterase I
MTRFADRLRSGRPTTMTALGDSLTVGYMVRRGYLDMVETSLRERFPSCDLRVANQGVCGDTIFDGTRRAPQALFSTPPNAALIQFGLNDCFSGVTREQFKEATGELVSRLRALSPDTEVVLVPAPPCRTADFDGEAEPFRTAYEELGNELSVLVAPVPRLWRTRSPELPLWLTDGVHPTEGGYRIMAETVLEVLAPRA